MPERDDFAELEQKDAGGAPDKREDSAGDRKISSRDAGKLRAFLSGLHVFFRKGSSPNLILVLTVITLFVSAALGLVYQVTAPIIEAAEKEAGDRAMRQVVPADYFEQSASDSGVYVGRYGDGAPAGYAVKVAPAGYGGAISMIVGVGADGAVTGVVIISHSETPGIGSKVAGEKWFTEQFAGYGGVIEIGRGVDAVTGATVSSRAVTAGVREAVSRAAAAMAGR